MSTTKNQPIANSKKKHNRALRRINKSIAKGDYPFVAEVPEGMILRLPAKELYECAPDVFDEFFEELFNRNT